MDLRLNSCAAEYSLIIVAMLYSASLTVSTSFQNTLTSKHTCNPLIPFGECLIGEYEATFEVHSNTGLQYLISFVVALLAGLWSDSHGRRRRPLILLSIIGQILTDGLYFVKHFWYWPSTFDIIFTSVVPGLYVGRNMFWISVMSYVSENSTLELRTRKLGTIIATYTVSSLMGSGVVALLKMRTRYYYYYTLFMVPVVFNLFAFLVGYLFVKDNSDSYNKNIIWLRPRCIIKGFTALFKNKLKSFAVSLGMLIICQSVLVARIGGEYVLIMQHIKNSLTWYDNEYVYFAVIKMMVLVFGIMFSVTVLSTMMKVNDLVIGIFACALYIVAAVCYIVVNTFWQIVMIIIIYLCHGIAVTITTSLTSKMVEVEELGRLNSIQTSMNSLFTFGIIAMYTAVSDGTYHNTYSHLCLVILLYVISTLPILYAFIILFTKCKDFWEKDTTPAQQNSIYVISR